MNVTVSAVTESALAALALGNLQHLLPQLASKRHGRRKRRCRLSLVPCISASLYQNQREQSQGPSSHFTVLLSYPNIIHCQSCFSLQDKPSPLYLAIHVPTKGKTTKNTEYNNLSQTLRTNKYYQPSTFLSGTPTPMSPQFQGWKSSEGG